MKWGAEVRLPASSLPDCDEAWCVSFDFIIGSTGTPADGYSLSWGPIAGQPVGGANENGFVVDDTLALATVTYNNSGARGVKMFETLPGFAQALIANPSTADVFGDVIPNGTTNMNGRFTAVFDGTGIDKLISWTTTGTANNAAFEDFVTTIATAETNSVRLPGGPEGPSRR